MRKKFILSIFIILISEIIFYFKWIQGLWSLLFFGPYILIGTYDLLQTSHAILRNFPFFGWGRYVMEILRPKIYQYFIESDIDGRPIGRIFRSLVYQRAKGDISTTPFGTQLDVNEAGYEWMNHSINAKNMEDLSSDLRITVGNERCKQKYNASILNISAMSFGSLSKNAIEALNKGAKLDNFAHNTGEGGISPSHLKHKGDLIWQIGTGYFGCRDKNGNFDENNFKKNALKDSVKMIEIKLSQGAKPGHGGILPAAKNTKEISLIRGVEPHTDIISPPFHTTFSNPIELIKFIEKLRVLSNGKPIGFKLCVGNKIEFISICKAMIKLNIYPDFITVDGGEGGTGAAPLEYSNSIGMPLSDGLSFVSDMLIGFDIKKHIKIIASGKIITGFNIVRNIALGADMVNSARAMMLALGCIQALECNKNICPTGIATQNPELTVGLVVKDKAKRVENYHRETVHSVIDLLSATGNNTLNGLSRYDINRRINAMEVKRFDEIYNPIKAGSFINGEIPENIKEEFTMASEFSFDPLKSN
jgi:glutamate synthase domain-containing protein 2